MKTAKEDSAVGEGKKPLSSETLSRILHTNDLHSNLIGVSPASDFTPFTLNDDQRGEVQDYGAGPARIAFLWRRQNEADSVPLIKGGTWVSAVAGQSIG
jgi:2',3'-cyclic-nucleotide 2'-phosphodiesterase (5'-nucleotidase family)